MKHFGWIAFLVSCVLFGPSVVSGQSSWSVGLIGGPSQYDLSGTGTARFSGIRLDVVPTRTQVLVIEAGLHYFRDEPEFGLVQSLWFPEVSVQLQLPAQVIRPYIGAGAGFVFGSEVSAPTLSASLGSRFRVADQWLLRGELRVRSVDPWVGTTADWGVGLSRSF